MSDVQSTKLSGAYWRLWTASAISNIGDGVFAVALPLLAVRVTDDRVSIGLISAFFSIPWLLFALPAGAIIDRVDRRKLLVAADLFRGVLIAGLAVVAAFTDVQVWMLWVLAFGLGLGEVFFDSTSQAILPAIVPGPLLERANGLRYSAEVTANTFLGAPIGGALFGVAVWLPFGIDAATFVGAALLAASLRGSFRPLQPPTHGTLRSEMRSGFQWLWRHDLLRSLTLGLGMTNLAFATSQATFVLFVRKELGVSESFFGPLVAIIGAGGVFAGLVGGRVISMLGRKWAIRICGAVPVLTMVAVGSRPVTWFVIVLTTIEAVMIVIWSILAVSLRQQLVPDHLFGRVNSVYRWFTWGAMPLGSVFGGVVAARFGLRAPYFAGAAIMLVAYLMVIRRVTESAINAAMSDVTEPSPRHHHDDDITPPSISRDILDDLLD